MRTTLSNWVNDADNLHYIQRFGFTEVPDQLNYLQRREDDYYISLVGELFDRLHHPYDDTIDWSRLGNAIKQAATMWTEKITDQTSISPESALFSAAAFYFGGYSASAYLTLRASNLGDISNIYRACYEFLSRPSTIQSTDVRAIIGAVRNGNLQRIREFNERIRENEASALQVGPNEWVGWRLFGEMVRKFETTNIRAVLPDGENEFWNPLVRSLLNRTPPAWDFFPSQIEAIQSGLLGKDQTFSIQMPTGSGKTALSEAILFYHLKTKPADAAILLVPYRSLASELRGSVVKRLNNMGLSARCVYGGTVPVGDEVHELANTRVIVATPEALSGLLSLDQTFFNRISLVICDEGHLLDGRSRGVGLELLLARFRARESGAPKFVFISAIVPNIEEINAWLGGTEDTVIRSDYRPALAEFAVLRSSGSGVNTTIGLQLHPHDVSSSFSITGFLNRNDFQYTNPETGRLKTYPFYTMKTQAVAAARKALSMGAVALFAANKHGSQGAVGLTQEIINQLSLPLSLSSPTEFIADVEKLQASVEYYRLEYGHTWIGTRALEAGIVLHHGDIPQESREVVESLVREQTVRLAICTNTLAEGVNLPIRTLVLYSVQRRRKDGAAENLLARDIKNLVGRAGRAGVTTKGLVICANANQWPLVEPVALQQPGERVRGALLILMQRLRSALSTQNIVLTNEVLESTTDLHTLVDGIDATLIDLMAEELGDDELTRIATKLSSETFAASQAEPETTLLIQNVFELRAQRIASLNNSGRLSWIRKTGTRVRMLETVETHLLPLRERWDDINSQIDPALIDTLLVWAWDLPEMRSAMDKVYRQEPPPREDFYQLLLLWMDGQPFVEIARRVDLNVDTVLSIHATVLSYVLQVVIEQGISLLEKILEENEQQLSQAVIDFPEYLRFGVSTQASCILAAGGVRHRRAAVLLGQSDELNSITIDDKETIFGVARQLLEDRTRWIPLLGVLVLENTIEDLEQNSPLTDEN